MRRRAETPSFVVLESGIAVQAGTEQPSPRAAVRRRKRPAALSIIGVCLSLVLVAWLIVNAIKEPTDFFNVFLIGLTTGCVYALVALGYTLVYGILQLINFAHGDVFMLGGMFTITYATDIFGLHHGERFAIVPIVIATLLLAMLTCGVLNATI